MINKLSILASLIVLIPQFCLGQTLSVSKLIEKSKCENFECFNEFVTEKGFSYFVSEKESNGTYYLYMSDKQYPASNNNQITTSNSAIICFNADGTVSTGTRTAVKSQYLLLMNELKNLGFVASKTKSVIDGVAVDYISSAYPNISITVQTDRLKKDELSWTSYDVAVLRRD